MASKKLRKNEIKEIREWLGMSRREFGHFLEISTYEGVMNMENGVRRPNPFALKVLRYLASLSKSDALAFIEDLSRHEPK